jgi:hypothetical protein
MDINEECYKFMLHTFKAGYLDSFVDATYVITIPYSKRDLTIRERLLNYTPTKKVYILHNKTFKKCKKQLKKNLPPYDLKDAYFTVMKHSLRNNYKNILILEDDFIFGDNLKNPFILNEISHNMDLNKNKPYYYNLGALPILFYPNLDVSYNIDRNTHYGMFEVGSSAIIYNRQIQRDILKNENTNVKHWDFFISLYYPHGFYNKPLTYQVYERTENQKYWTCDDVDTVMCRTLDKMQTQFLKSFDLDKNAHNGYHTFFKMSFILHYLLIIIILFLILYFVWKLNKNKNK